MNSVENVKQLLHSANKVVDEHNNKKIQSGESFNIFSILDMERKENKTHSRFLSELLSPNGSHLKGNAFLNLFLETINHDSPKDFDEATVTPNHYIGKVDLPSKTGGYIDIYIESKSRDNALTIENKIYAEDRELQIERYCNYNKKNNKVYYLTLHGDEPSKFSKGNLESGRDYFIISYKGHIVHWLEKCIEECIYEYDSILKETIKQYIHLIKKLTSKMVNEKEIEILKLVLTNFDTAKLINQGLKSFLHNYNNEFRKMLYSSLSDKLANNYEVINEDDGNNKFDRKILIRIKDSKSSKFCFGITNFSTLNPLAESNLIWIGIHANQQNINYNFKKFPILGNVQNNAWVLTANIQPFDYNGNLWIVSLQEEQFVLMLIKDEAFLQGVINHITKECISFCEYYYEDIKEIE